MVYNGILEKSGKLYTMVFTHWLKSLGLWSTKMYLWDKWLSLFSFYFLCDKMWIKS